MSEHEPTVTLVRHGETEWSLSGQHTGRTDIPLTERGRAQAEALGRRLAGTTFAAVFTSPLARAMETCKLAGFGDQAVATDDLMEWDYGDYEGRRTADIRVLRPGWLLWTDGVPNGETADDVRRRVDRVIARVRAVEGDVALFAHGHILRALAARWIDADVAMGGHLALTTGGISVLGWERELPAIDLWNDLSTTS
jgi:broad specificity phosphatase PhoE